MPIYRFQCDKCEKEFEDLVAKRGDTSPCPECGCEKVHRMVTMPAARVSSDGGGRGQISSSCPPSCSCSTGKCSHH